MRRHLLAFYKVAKCRDNAPLNALANSSFDWLQEWIQLDNMLLPIILWFLYLLFCKSLLFGW